MGSSGGSITLRLAVAGSAEVKAALASLGPVGANALRQIQQAQAAPTAGMLALNAAGKDVTAGLQGMAGRAGAFGSALMAIGPAGLAAAAGLGAVVAIGAKMVQGAVAAANWAEDIEKASKALGLNTTELQAFDFVAQSANIPVEKMRTSLSGLTRQIGQTQNEFAKGRSVKVWEAILGTTDPAAAEKQLKQLGDLEHILPVIVQYASKLSATERGSLAASLKIDPEVLNTLIDAKGGIAGLIDEAHKYGIIVDEDVVRKSADAAREMHIASTVMNDEMRVAMANLAPAAADTATKLTHVVIAIGDIIRGAGDALGPLQKLIDKLTQVPNAAGKGGGPLAGFFSNPAVGNIIAGSFGPAGELARIGLQGLGGLQQKGAQDRLHQPTMSIRDIIDADQNKANAGNAANVGGGRPPRARGDTGPTIDELLQHDKELEVQGAADVLKARKDELTAQLAMTKDVQQRLDIQTKINAIDDQQSDNERTRRIAEAQAYLDRVEAIKATTAAEKAEKAEKVAGAVVAVRALKSDEAIAAAAEAYVRSLRDRNAAIEASVALADQQAEKDKQTLQAQIDFLRALEPLAKTMADRRANALELFSLEERQKEKELQDQIDDANRNHDSAAARGLQSQLDSLRATAGPREAAVSEANPAGPWSAAMQKMRDDLVPLNQELEQVSADGLNDLNEGILNAKGNFHDMGEAAKDAFLKATSQLIVYIAKMAEMALIDKLIPGFSGGSGGGFNIASLFGGGGNAGAVGTSLGGMVGMAGGGLITGSGGPRSDNILIAASPGERVMNYSASQAWGPMLDAMNEAGRRGPIHVSRFAGGGVVGRSGSGLSAAFGGGPAMHVYVDARGADSAGFARLQDQVRRMGAWMHPRADAERFVNHAQAAKLLKSRK